MVHALQFGDNGESKETIRRTCLKALHFGGSGEGEKVIRRTCMKALHFDGSSEGEEAIERTRVNALHFGDGDNEKAAIRTWEMMTGIGRGTPIRRKSPLLCDVQGKVSRPIFNFVHFVDDVVSKAHDFSVVKTEY